MSQSGVIIIDKPAGMTSHDVVQRVRRKLGVRRVGHAGTLDPDVTGVLVLCVGNATRLLEYAAAADKVYEGTVCFGAGTDTDDAAGVVIATASAACLTEDAVRRAASSFIGEIEQMVPRYSAVHVAGRRAYELARTGADVELPTRIVRIRALEVIRFAAGEKAYAEFRVDCSKGTYVRALCRDWGRLVGVPAHLLRLRRVAAGRFQIAEAVPLDRFLDADDPWALVLPPAAAVRGMPRHQVSSAEARRLAAGQAIPVAAQPEGLTAGEVAVFGAEGELVCIAEWQVARRGTELRPRKVFAGGAR